MIKSKNIMKKNKQKRKVWTPEEDNIMKTLYPTATMFELLEWFPDRSERSIYSRATTLELLKTKEFRGNQMERITRELAESGKAHRFRKGDIPANKGKKQTEYMTAEGIERSKATRFKKGVVSHNVVPVGTISERRNERRKTVYLYIKEKEHHWEQLHRHVWKNHYGEIPKGHNIIFKDGNTLNCEIDNLECVSDEKNMLRNSIQRYPEELRDVMQLTGRLKKKIIKKNSEKTV